jgi:hypothetical protein
MKMTGTVEPTRPIVRDRVSFKVREGIRELQQIKQAESTLTRIIAGWGQYLPNSCVLAGRA